MEELQVNPVDLNDHNLESEKSVLGAILNDGVNTKVIGILDITDFYLDSHQYIWRAIEYLHKNKQPIDLVLVSIGLARLILPLLAIVPDNPLPPCDDEPT